MDNKLISTNELFVSPLRINNPCLFSFFSSVLEQFGKELQHLANHLYQYPHGIDGNHGFNDVFALIERSYVGIFNNAIVKCFPDDAVLQEFSVHLGGRKYVRCDYLVKYITTDRIVNILFEAKQRTFDGKKYSTEGTKVLLDSFLEQGSKYYQPEKKYYEGETFISSLVFEWVRHKKQLEQVVKWENKDDGITDFYRFYHSDSAGLMVYGSLKKVSP